jgi:hypothetical protein
MVRSFISINGAGSLIQREKGSIKRLLKLISKKNKTADNNYNGIFRSILAMPIFANYV